MEILKHLSSELSPPPLRSEKVSFLLASGRIIAEKVVAQRPLPTYAEATRDGFAVGESGEDGCSSYQLIDKVAAAGNTDKIVLDKGQACPVMTGGLLPVNTEKVVPQEFCQVDETTLQLDHFLPQLPPFIRKIGGEYSLGKKLIGPGTIVRPEHIALLASTGNLNVSVYNRPRVGFFSTGSELVDVTELVLPGKKVASNRYLLSELCALFGAESSDLGTVPDTAEELTFFFMKLADTDHDMVISTGGMGPGRFDLVEECFRAAGGRVIVNKLRLRPGKSILIGWLGEKIFYGLPGTPHAIRPLFTELIARSLLSLQGYVGQFPFEHKAILSETLEGRATGTNAVCLTPGCMSYRETTCVVRPSTQTELPHCYIVINPHQGSLAAGTVVNLHLLRSPFCS